MKSIALRFFTAGLGKITFVHVPVVNLPDLQVGDTLEYNQKMSHSAKVSQRVWYGSHLVIYCEISDYDFARFMGKAIQDITIGTKINLSEWDCNADVCSM